MVDITIDDRRLVVREGMTVLQVAQENGIDIPTLCFHPALKPAGACKLCIVEVNKRDGRQMTMLACVLKVRDGAVIRTNSEMVKTARQKAVCNLLQLAPGSVQIRRLADKYGVDVGQSPDDCIRCRLCIRVCKDVVGAEALCMEKRGSENFVIPIPGACIGCGTCVNICPTDHIQLTDEENVRTISIRDEVIGKHPLETCDACGKRFATSKFLHYVEKCMEPLPRLKEKHRCCPTCARLLSSRVQSLPGV